MRLHTTILLSALSTLAAADCCNVQAGHSQCASLHSCRRVLDYACLDLFKSNWDVGNYRDDAVAQAYVGVCTRVPAGVARTGEASVQTLTGEVARFSWVCHPDTDEKKPGQGCGSVVLP